MKTFSITDTGVLREMNQDYFFESENPVGNLPNLFVVADGMGGHKAGEYASRYTTERVVASIARSKEEEPVSILREAVRKANELLITESREDESKKGMGTTLVIATIIDDRLVVANVGDSRLYVVNNRITQITRDHSFVDEMVRLGKIAPEDARLHPDKNKITRAIGAVLDVEADFFEYELNDDDYILMCTDGLSNMVCDEDILNIMKNEDSVERMAVSLVKTANTNGGRDNITVMIIKPLSDEVRKC
ncbi:MAG: Stp1/IreP family PP2C-type Ser/Thr phosphatase [Agathobacter sp.]|nr:Stp1/IreP family PP2C-type Ser/Thr phosphatase [Agathobacter sp.]